MCPFLEQCLPHSRCSIKCITCSINKHLWSRFSLSDCAHLTLHLITLTQVERIISGLRGTSERQRGPQLVSTERSFQLRSLCSQSSAQQSFICKFMQTNQRPLEMMRRARVTLRTVISRERGDTQGLRLTEKGPMSECFSSKSNL